MIEFGKSLLDRLFIENIGIMLTDVAKFLHKALIIIPREARGYSVELFGLSVRPSVRLSVCPSVRPSVPKICTHISS